MPSFVRIWNDEDNDVLLEYYRGMSDGLAIQQSASGTFTGGALVGGTITASFSGDAPKSSETLTVTHDASPGGNAVYIAYADSGEPYLECNMAVLAADQFLALSGSAKLKIKHNASPAGSQVYVRESDGMLLADNPSGSNEFIRCPGGDLMKVEHDASASSNGVAVNFDDGGDNRLEATFVGAADVDMNSETASWLGVAPAGSVSGSADGTCAGSISGMVSEISADAITLTERGFDLGTDSVVNELNKTFRYIAVR
jgi:hypothetical protein